MSRTEFITDFFGHVDAVDFDWCQDYLASDCCIEAPGFSQQGGEVVILWMAGFFAAFPDLKHRPYQVASEGDSSAFLVEVTGTHTEDLALPDGGVVPPTGRQLRMVLGEFWTFDAEKITEYRVIYDQAEFMTQLGLM